MIRLYHFSDYDFKDKIKTDYFGNNSYSQFSLRISQVKRTYFYLNPKNREKFFKGSQFLYIGEVKEADLYDLRTDKLNLAEKLRGKDVFDYFKAKGYKGLIGNNGLDLICLFYDVPIYKKINLKNNDLYAIL